jgi:hypothetical protein
LQLYAGEYDIITRVVIEMFGKNGDLSLRGIWGKSKNNIGHKLQELQDLSHNFMFLRMG